MKYGRQTEKKRGLKRKQTDRYRQKIKLFSVELHQAPTRKTSTTKTVHNLFLCIRMFFLNHTSTVASIYDAH